MQNKSQIKTNILKFLEYQNITKPEFYRKTSITRGILDQNNGISEENITRFLATFPIVDANWLLSGKGSMIKNSSPGYKNSNNNDTLVDQTPKSTNMNEVDLLENPTEISVPYFNEYASAGLMLGIADGKIRPDAYINVPGYSDCDLAINVYGESMYPEYRSGEIVICKKVPVDSQMSYIRFGEAYIAICDDGPVLKYIKRTDDNDYLVFESANEKYQPYLVHKSRIQELYIVKGVITRKNL